MAEQLVLTTPQTFVSLTEWQVASLQLERFGPNAPRIEIWLVSNTGQTLRHIYRDAVASSLMIALNSANLSIKSLQRRVLERLVADGVLTGTISGTPD